MTYGFITIVPVPELGYSGGLLILRDNGKPVEFHCTAPVAENRAQKILYGSTYEPFVYCDQIGNALIGKCTVKPELFVTDTTELMGLDESVEQPVIMVEPVNGDDSTFCHEEQTSSQRFSIGEFGLTVSSEDLQVCDGAKESCRRFAANLPIDEPFERIRQAIGEAQAVAR